MKIFLDTADIQAIETYLHTGLIDGITTNPTHLSKTGKHDILSVINQICTLLPNKPISVEITEIEPEAVYQQALDIALIAPNIVIKIPCFSAYLAIIKKLVSKDIKINITLLFSLTQALMMCKLNVAYISPFIGRLEDIDSNGIKLIADIRTMIKNYNFQTQLLAASLRTVNQLHKVALIGADIATVPVELLKKAIRHPLTEEGMKIFAQDWKKLDIKKFP